MKPILLGFSLLFALAVPLSAQSSDEPAKNPVVIRWQINHYPKKYFFETAEKMNQLLSSSTAGRVVVKAIAPVDDKWDIERKAEYSKVGVRVGEYDMVQSYTFLLTEYEPRLHLFDLPYFFTGHDHFERVVESPLGEQLVARLRDYGFEPVGLTYSGGMVAVPARKAIHAVEDFKGLKYRAWEHQVNLETQRLLGTTILNGHLLRRSKKFPLVAAFESGVAEAGDCETIELGQFSAEKGLYYNMLEHRMLATVLLMNKSVFDALSKDDQVAVKRAAKEAANWERHQIIAAEAEQLKSLKAEGRNVVTLTAAEKEKFRKALQPVHKMYESQIGVQLLNDAKKMGAEPRKLVRVDK